jgi:hypothetical protein
VCRWSRRGGSCSGSARTSKQGSGSAGMRPAHVSFWLVLAIGTRLQHDRNPPQTGHSSAVRCRVWYPSVGGRSRPGLSGLVDKLREAGARCGTNEVYSRQCKVAEYCNRNRQDSDRPDDRRRHDHHVAWLCSYTNRPQSIARTVETAVDLGQGSQSSPAGLDSEPGALDRRQPAQRRQAQVAGRTRGLRQGGECRARGRQVRRGRHRRVHRRDEQRQGRARSRSRSRTTSCRWSGARSTRRASRTARATS